MSTITPLRTPPVSMPASPRPARLAAIARGIGAAPDLWRRHVHHDPDRRTWALLLATPLYDAWVLGWSPGQGIPLHDHGDSAGALSVVGGTLLEVYERDPGAVELATRVLRAGTTVTFGTGYRHGLTNVHEVAATSIHVYSPPLPPDAPAPTWAP